MKLSEKILAWANDKDLLKSENISKQFKKLKEEVGELGVEIRLLSNLRELQYVLDDSLSLVDEIALKKIEMALINKIALEIGDNGVVLEILAKQVGLSFKDCRKLAYKKIKHRTGKTINRTFVKD